MCSSLADGGLRCPSHISKDIQAIHQEDSKNFNNAAKAAGVPVDQKFVTQEVAKSLESYSREAATHAEQLQASENNLSEAKSELAQATKNLSESAPAKENPKVAKELSREESLAVAIVTKHPYFSTFDRKQDYVDNTKLLEAQSTKIFNAKKDLEEKIEKLQSEKESELHAKNPELKKLRKKAALAKFFRSSTAEGKQEKYKEALKAAKQNPDFTAASIKDFPKDATAMQAQQKELQSLTADQKELRNSYEESICKQTGQDKTSVDHASMENTIQKFPSNATATETAYQYKLRKATRIQGQQEQLASKEYNIEKATTKFHAEATSKAPFQPAKLKEYREKVYDKSPQGKKTIAALKEKNAQLSLTAKHRSDLGKQATSFAASGHTEHAAKLLAQKRKLDILAEKTMGENRLKALSNA